MTGSRQTAEAGETAGIEWRLTQTPYNNRNPNTFGVVDNRSLGSRPAMTNRVGLTEGQ
jgi:hypothetical protein